MDLTVIFRLAISLILGFIIGMERSWQSRQSPEDFSSAGIRSFGFVGLLGGVSALLAREFNPSILAFNFLGFALLVSVSYLLTARQSKDFGTTTELALLITFVLGALAVSGLETEALAAAVVMSVLLKFKQELHQTLEGLNPKELMATLQLLLLAAVAIPLLPNRNLGPWDALNPRTVGFLVLLIAGISYIGYFAMRVFGSRVGILITGILGGLTSSTAVTIAFARMARRKQGSIPILAAGISLANGTMAPRLLVEVGVVNSSLAWRVAIPVMILGVIPLLAALVITTHSSIDQATAEVELSNPTELGTALGYGILLTALFFLVRAAEAWFGKTGIYALSAISGIADVDAVSISLAQAVRGGIPEQVAIQGIMIAVAANTMTKGLLASLIGGWQLACWCVTILAIALSISLISVFLLN